MRQPNQLTDKEAATKWCPMARCVVWNDDLTLLAAGANLDMKGKVVTDCIGSGCMMWRKDGQIGLNPEGKVVDRDMDGRTRWTDVGHCGLAPVKVPDQQQGLLEAAGAITAALRAVATAISVKKI